MAENRVRKRVRLNGAGGGMIVSSQKRFQFEVADFSIKGILFIVVKGTVPGRDEEVMLTVRIERPGEAVQRFSLTGTVRRHAKRRDRLYCGIEVVEVRNRQDAAAMDQAYLDQYFESLF